MQIYFLDFKGDDHFHSTITEHSPKRKAFRRLKREIIANSKSANEKGNN